MEGNPHGSVGNVHDRDVERGEEGGSRDQREDLRRPRHKTRKGRKGRSAGIGKVCIHRLGSRRIGVPDCGPSLARMPCFVLVQLGFECAEAPILNGDR